VSAVLKVINIIKNFAAL